ncbi:hypothetical protein C4B63_95g45 [Trypanosoma cruzi]|uniref:Uncharacterized protein n=1 Tax=Trypanosoma cruzi TaxID=5693 RepID=A0A2V2UVP8_TRYCR|nr:hypothetical protein C4B63_95g45 [Trypanosoma cruzi]
MRGMWRLTLPLRTFSSSFSNSRRLVGRETVFLPWNARPWPSYETHADQWRFLDRTLSAVVGMTPAEVSAKSLRLCPRRLLQDIEDPALMLQRRRQRALKQQQEQEQQRRRRRTEEPSLNTSVGARKSCAVTTSNTNKDKSACGVLEERRKSTAVAKLAPASIPFPTVASSTTGRGNNRARKKRELVDPPVGMPEDIPASSSSLSAATSPPAATRTTTAAAVCVPATVTAPKTSINASINNFGNTSANRSSSSCSSSSARTPATALDTKTPVRHPRTEKTTTTEMLGKGEKRNTNNGNKLIQHESKMLTSTASIEAIKNEETEESRMAVREFADLKESTSILHPPLRKLKQSRSQGKGGKRGNK